MSIPKWPNLYPYTRGTSTVDGLAGHFILSNRCLFRLHHHILSKSRKRFRVSTVGYLPDDMAHADGEEGKWYNFSGAFDDEGTKCETMVFEEEARLGDGHMAANYTELECRRSTDSIEATSVHMNLVKEYLEL